MVNRLQTFAFGLKSIFFIYEPHSFKSNGTALQLCQVYYNSFFTKHYV